MVDDFFFLPMFDTLFQAVDGFVIVVNSDQKIMYVSQSCEKYLGHQNVRNAWMLIKIITKI